MSNEFPQAAAGSTPPEKPDTTLEIVREKLLDPHYLPTHEEIKKAFPSLGDWSKFCEKNHIYELWNKEYINALADYLADRAAKLGKLSIVEIGAGNGKLSRLLTNVLQVRGLDAVVEITPTDSNSWGLSKDFLVAEVGYEQALERFKPNLVISSWMPVRTDWTKTIRQFDCVKEYILIGDPTCCGDEESTWGSFYFERPFRAGSFEREEVAGLHRLQICRGDVFREHDVSGIYHTEPHSYTMSFKRV